MHVVIDADQLVYSCGFACEGEPLAHVLHTVKSGLKKIIRETDADSWTVYIGGSGNFRVEIGETKPYKGTRPMRQPSTYAEIRDYLIDKWDAVVVDGMEADDAVSIELFSDYAKSGGDKDRSTLILSSPDKDLLNTPGWHYNPRSGQVTWINHNTAYVNFLTQMLVGDSVDNIPGLPYVHKSLVYKWGLKNVRKIGCGKKTAEQIVNRKTFYNDVYADVVEAYLVWGEAEGMSETQTRAYFLEQAQLLWMVRELDEFDNPVMFTIEEVLYGTGKRNSGCYSLEEGTGRESGEDGGGV